MAELIKGTLHFNINLGPKVSKILCHYFLLFMSLLYSITSSLIIMLLNILLFCVADVWRHTKCSYPQQHSRSVGPGLQRPLGRGALPATPPLGLHPSSVSAGNIRLWSRILGKSKELSPFYKVGAERKKSIFSFLVQRLPSRMQVVVMFDYKKSNIWWQPWIRWRKSLHRELN